MEIGTKRLHDGVFSAMDDSMPMQGETADPVNSAQNNFDKEPTGESVEAAEISIIPIASAVQSLASTSSEGMELILYSKVGMGDGQQASNPWLQEFPDPITRVSWDNYLTVSKADAKC